MPERLHLYAGKPLLKWLGWAETSRYNLPGQYPTQAASQRRILYHERW